MSTARVKAVKRPSVKAVRTKVKGAALEQQTFASVFDAIADTPQEAASMQARAQLARQINAVIRHKRWTQAIAAQHCGVTQPRINDLLNGRVSRFSLDALVNIASAIGKVNVELTELEPA